MTEVEPASGLPPDVATTATRETRRSKRTKKANLITERERIHGFQQIEAKIKALNLKRYGSEQAPGHTPVVIVGRSKDRLGTVAAKEQTVRRYQGIIKGFLDFCIYMGDYESAILPYQTKCPKNPPPVCDWLAIVFLRYCVQRDSEPVTDPNTDEPIEVRGQPLLSVQNWTGKSTIQNFQAALSMLHNQHDSTRQKYTEACPECQQISFEGIKKGESCGNHGGPSCYWRQGNVITSPKFRQHIKIMKEYAKENYCSSSAASFLPSHLRAIRKHLLSQNNGSLDELMRWTVIILGVRLFLRVDEVLNLEIDSFIPQYFVIKGKKVVSLCVKITNGKTDDDAMHFQVYDDPDYPELSPVRPLLLFIAASNRKKGFLFPQKEQMFDVNPTKPYRYSKFNKDLSRLVKVIIGMDLAAAVAGQHLIAGTHMLRKTAFLLAYWAIKMEMIIQGGSKVDDGIPVEDQAAILNDARMTLHCGAPSNGSSATASTMLLDPRHASIASTSTYLGDAATLFALYKRLGMSDLSQRVGPYMPIFIKSLGNFISIATENDLKNGLNTKNLPELAAWFVFDVMEVDRHTVLKDNVPELCETAHSLLLGPEKDNSPSLDHLMEQLRPHLPPDLFAQVTGHFVTKRLDHENGIVPPANMVPPIALVRTPPAGC